MSPSHHDGGSPKRPATPALGTLAWERAGGPPLTPGQRGTLAVHAAAVLLGDLWSRLGLRLLKRPAPRRVDLGGWAPPDTRIAREAERLLGEAATREIVHHSHRAYYFAGIVYELDGAPVPLDREVLYVAALLHDVALAKPRPSTERCFTIGGAREARRIMTEAGWEDARQDRAALAIVANPNIRVPVDRFGAEAHYFTVGGMVEVIAQEWKVHPDNLAEVLARHPRDGYAAGVHEHLCREIALAPGSRFACLNPLFPAIARRARFRSDPKG